MVKCCTKCKRELDDQEFSWNGARMHTQCKGCISAHIKAYNQTPRGKAKHAEYVAKNRDKIKAYMKDYYQRNKWKNAAA